jgi:hypothetical protein
MADITVRQVDRGFNAQVRDAVDLKRGAAADGSRNVLYSRGIAKTPYGFNKVESGSLPLDSGNPILGLGTYSELDKTQHFLAVTNDTIQERDALNSEWDDLTQSGVVFGANIFNPISFATILHTDAIKLNGSGDDWYHHSLVCNGGVTCIQRWAGKFETDYADLLGADGYHHASSGRTTHFARQVVSFYNHVILISPKIADANDDLKDNNQMVRWGAAGKLELYSGTGSGNKQLVDTGGYNVWAALMGAQLMIYQNNSVYSLNHIGGEDVFDPRIEMDKLGLLAPHLLHSKGNVHYFVGNDYNLYRYFGGSNKEIISNNIQRFLERDLDPAYQHRCWLQVGAQNSRLWLFIVPNGQNYVTQAYAVDLKSGSWMKRDYTHKWTTASTGITSVSLVGAGSYEAGMSYAELVATGKTYADLVTEGTTYKQLVQTTLTEERMVLGDAAGNVYQYDSDATQDDGVDIPSQHLTDVEDLGAPGKNKLWPGVTITAKGTNVTVSYRIGNFETTDTGWTSLGTQALNSEYTDYFFVINNTSKKIQLKFSHTADDWQVSNYVLKEPQLQGEV